MPSEYTCIYDEIITKVLSYLFGEAPLYILTYSFLYYSGVKVSPGINKYFIFSIARCSDGQLRLAERSTYYGRVEICSDQRWNALSHYYWSYTNARIACIELGFQGKIILMT